MSNAEQSGTEGLERSSATARGSVGGQRNRKAGFVVRAYECNIKGTDWQRTVYALSAGKAKCEYWRDVKEAWQDTPFTAVTVRVASRAPKTDERFLHVADSRGLPFARMGMAVEADGTRGVLAGVNDSSNFEVVFTEGPRKGCKLACHPWWKMKYFDAAGNLLKEFGA